MPVLANVLLAARDDRLSVTGTDLEVELVATCPVSVQQPGDITVPGRKLLDIFRSLPEKTSVTVSTEGERVSLRADAAVLPCRVCRPRNFRWSRKINAQQTLSVAQGEFRRLMTDALFDGPAGTCAITSTACCSRPTQGAACGGDRRASPRAV